MTQIKILSDDLASRIAAGEVIERPASVVKELVENSLDAGSTRVDVQVVGGGAKSIVVIDNGMGIPSDQITTAFERFATSKIDESSDLISIPTLGFRGEALPSIASVARVITVSMSTEAAYGVKYHVDFGKPGQVEKIGAPQGTRIEVTDLFNNTPARLKFLGSAGRELARVQSILASLALVNPHVTFNLVADGRDRLRTIGSGKLMDSIAGVYGQKIADQMIPLEPGGSSAFAVDGVVSSPSLTRANRMYITISVNGRWIQSRRLSYAIEQAYHGFLPERRFPLALLRIRTPLEDVDPNVHPAKAQVRFLREDLVFSIVQRAIRGILSASAPIHEIGASRMAGSSGLLRAADLTEVGSGTLEPGISSTQGSFVQKPDPLLKIAQGQSDEMRDDIALTVSEGGPTPRETLPVLRVIGQAHETYIVAEGPEGLYLIDQHAAHERVTFEFVKYRFDNGESEYQPLLEPLTVDLAPGVMTTVQEHQDDLNKVGWRFEEFGKNSLILRSVPGPLSVKVSADGASQVLIRVLDELASGGAGDTWSHRLIATIACHASVRAGQSLSIDDCKNLVRQLEQTERPNTCPHGRPTIVRLRANDLEREFKRR
ncbi:MAG: DNA mismatch repair endonuclease MutL [SAR202 cluster bacterium]|nr:DNA mismatch repair endonuclease MutL [SAR202 cluster bacterium]